LNVRLLKNKWWKYLVVLYLKNNSSLMLLWWFITKKRHKLFLKEFQRLFVLHNIIFWVATIVKNMQNNCFGLLIWLKLKLLNEGEKNKRLGTEWHLLELDLTTQCIHNNNNTRRNETHLWKLNCRDRKVNNLWKTPQVFFLVG
jgi:hypothetical protein